MIDPVTAFVLFSAASSAMGALLLRSIRRANARRAEVWKKAAELLGGEFLLTRGPWQDRLPMAIRARVNGVHVCADSYVVSSGQSSNTWTRIVATNRDAPEVRIEVRERSLLTSVGRLLGAQDVDVSRPELSEHVIKAGDESIARAWISPSVARAIVACAPYTFSCGDKLSVVRAALEDDADRLARTARATAAFAARGDEIVAAWSSLASALSGVVEEPLVLVDRAVQGKITVLRSSVEVSIEFALDDARTITTIRSRRTKHDDEFTIERAAVRRLSALPHERGGAGGGGDPAFDSAYTLDMADTTSAPSAEARDKLLACMPMKVIAHREHLTLLLEGLELDHERVRNAVDAVALLAIGSPDGPYR